MFSVCRTRPVHGAAKYSSRWRAVFQANVATPAVGRDAERVEHAAEATRALRPVGVGHALATGGRRGDHALVPEVLLRPLEQGRDREWHVLHQPLHAGRLGPPARIRGLLPTWRTRPAGRTGAHAPLPPHPPVRRVRRDARRVRPRGVRRRRRRHVDDDRRPRRRPTTASTTGDVTATADTTDTSDDARRRRPPPRRPAARSGPARTTSRRPKAGFPVDDEELGECIAEALISDDVYAQIEELGVTAEQFGDDGPAGLGITLDEEQADGDRRATLAACGDLADDVLADEDATRRAPRRTCPTSRSPEYVTFALFSVDARRGPAGRVRRHGGVRRRRARRRRRRRVGGGRG